ncbi:MAG: beta-galactosidase [Phycisphaerae bacterium]|nr:beta-galactosidase [Phycisphaerae bacterium]
MAEVTYDDRSFLIDGQRVWLVGGSIHYFRVPRALWRDRLVKARRAGLNCISTYVAWNVHEPQEGQWRLDGEQDVSAFIKLAGDLGLYVILRPGPYICSEWDFGGLPGWLTARSHMAFRTANAAYMHYFDKYFRTVLTPLAAQQVTRGGNILLIQNENEYQDTTMPDRLKYLEFISQLYRRAGFDIPILTCNHMTDPPVPEAVECLNSYGDEVQKLKRLSLRQPSAPLLFTEHHVGWYDTWGGEHAEREPADVARRQMEILGCGGQYNAYMFHGGTNFGFWGGRAPSAADAYQATSYDYDAPVAEGGGLTEKYYLTRLVNLLANHMGRFFAPCFVEEPGVSVHDGTDVLNLSGTAGRWAVVTNNGRDAIGRVRVSLPDGRELHVPLEPLGAAAVPVDLAVSDDVTLDYANLTPLGLFSGRTLVLHGPAGWAARFSVNGIPDGCEVPDGDEPVIVEHESLRVVVVSSDLAMRTWPLGDEIVFGPDYVGEDIEQDVRMSSGTRQYAVLPHDGKLTRRKVPEAVRRAVGTGRKPSPPRLRQWKRVAVCTEPVDDELEWEELPGPRDVDRLGVHGGYVWYCVEVDAPRAKVRQLFLPDCADRATLYLNGTRIGTWGRGDGAVRKPIRAPFKRGLNSLVALVDNLGRFHAGPRLGERKGLFGHIYDAKPLAGAKFKLKPLEEFSKRIIPRPYAHLAPTLAERSCWRAETSVSLTKVAPLHVSFADLPYDVAVLCNDKVCGFFPHQRRNFGDVTLNSALKKGRNKIALMLWGDDEPGTLKTVKLHALSDPISRQGDWFWRAWRMPTAGAKVVGKDQPAWYVTHFKYAPANVPLFVHIVGARKGQLFLNGHNVGRFWTVGPQQHYYLPECWLEEENELMVFEESGRIPAHSRLSFRPLGPFSE